MSVELDIFDVFDMAEQIETDAAAFYTAAASAATEGSSRDTLLHLAAMERDHELVFSALKASFLDADLATLKGTPSSAEQASWIGLTHMLASGAREELAGLFTGREATDDIIRKAIGFEKETIAFLVSMKHMLPDSAEAATVDMLIKEELGHILALSGELARPGGGKSAQDGSFTGLGAVPPPE